MPKVLPGQSLFDIALQEYGSIEAVFQLAEDNAFSEITQFINPGTEVMTSESKNKNVSNYYLQNKVKPASEIEVNHNSYNESYNESYN